MSDERKIGVENGDFQKFHTCERHIQGISEKIDPKMFLSLDLKMSCDSKNSVCFGAVIASYDACLISCCGLAATAEVSVASAEADTWLPFVLSSVSDLDAVTAWGGGRRKCKNKNRRQCE